MKQWSAQLKAPEVQFVVQFLTQFSLNQGPDVPVQKMSTEDKLALLNKVMLSWFVLLILHIPHNRMTASKCQQGSLFLHVLWQGLECTTFVDQKHI